MQGGIKRKNDLLPRYRKKNRNGLYQNMSKPLISNSCKRILAYISLLVLVYLILNFAYTDLNKIPMYELGDEGSMDSPLDAGTAGGDGNKMLTGEGLVVPVPAREKEDNIVEKLLAGDEGLDTDLGSGSGSGLGSDERLKPGLKSKPKPAVHAGSELEADAKGVGSPDSVPDIKNRVQDGSKKVDEPEQEIEIGAKGVVHLASEKNSNDAVHLDVSLDDDNDDDDDGFQQAPKELFNNEVARQRELENLKDTQKLARQKTPQGTDSRKLLQNGSKQSRKNLEKDLGNERLEEKKNILDLEKLKELSNQQNTVATMA